MKIIGVRFFINEKINEAHKVYSYLSHEAVAIGDLVVVESPYSGYTLAKVAAVTESVEGVEKAHKRIVCKIDTANYEAYKAKLEQKAVLEAKLKQEVAKARAMIDYEALAAKSPIIAELLAQLKED